MTTALATAETNAFLSYAKAVNQRTIVGDILKFSKGDWTAGQYEEEIDEGSRFVAIMDELLVGWIKWEGGRPVEHEMGKITDGFRPPARKDLGDNDETLWERDDRGDPRDPWVRTNYLILKEEEGDRLFTFAPSSRGGLSAVGLLCDTYGKMIRQNPDQFPVVAIETSSYRHDTYGKIKVPVLKVVGWTDKASTLAALEAGASDSRNGDTDDNTPF
jgi:hypothetical protein